ncbi:MAG: SGNH/GDSL hydrolase family protein [Armatimonadota bacterium]|nr:SGNH/GDSL hydrolase family protein [bacterium]
MKADKILILGNSITKHPGLENSGWPGKDWGMAASTPDKDYVHLLIKRFTEAAGGKAPEMMVRNIADFEREYDTYNISEALKACAEFKADIIILAINENVPDLTSDESQRLYHDALTRLLALLQSDNSPSLFVRSSFWPNEAKDAILRQVCAEVGGKYIDISNLSKDESNYARSERSFEHSGVADHPGDKGMASIADAIWNAIECRPM